MRPRRDVVFALGGAGAPWRPGTAFHYGEVARPFIYGSQGCQQNRVVSERKNDEDP